MKQNMIKNMLFSLFFVGIFTLGVSYIHQNFQPIFESFNLSPKQVSSVLLGLHPQCKNIKDCKLEKGDILIRRYITQRTWLINKLANPFFTHSAMYLGDDEIIEATGYEKDPKDEIRISSFSKSDWQDFGIESWVIVRVKNVTSKMPEIRKSLEIIADDPEYRFGLPKEGYKRLSCSDLILNTLISEGVVEVRDKPKIITPDYLFWLAFNNSDSFEIVGYSFNYQPD